MNTFISTLLDGDITSDTATKALPIIRYVFFAVIVAAAIVMIITTLLQSSENNSGMDAFTGAKQESYYSQNKGASRDSILKRITISMAVIIAVLVLAFFITELVVSVNAPSTSMIAGL